MGRSIVGEEVHAEVRRNLAIDVRQYVAIKPRRVVQKVADEAGQPRRQGRQQRTVAPVGDIRQSLARRAGLNGASLLGPRSSVSVVVART